MFTGITIHPIPAHDKVTIGFSSEQAEKECDIRIHSLEGELFYESGRVISEANYAIQLESFPKGIYVLSIEIDKKTMYHKLIVS